jgi:threonylcarbamoyladenosine tRNA methylthiotransferase MtaB
MAKVAFKTLGCKLNQAETESWLSQLQDEGYEIVDSPQEADVYLVNTCTVTHVADRKARHFLRLARRQNPQALIVAAGCYAERAPEELKQLGVVDLILGNKEKEQLPSELAKLGIKPNRFNHHPVSFRTRSLVKIQDGCNDFCSYCIVPYVRGRERSLPCRQILDEVKIKVVQGYLEVTLTGIKIGAYQDEGMNLTNLVRQILEDTGIRRLRLSSLQPMDLTADLISLWEDERLCPHFHLPLQSGSQGVLCRMRRRYSLNDYRKAISMIGEKIPDAAITTDILVGFPGETDEEFDESYHLCQTLPLAKIHVFSFSPRPGTLATKMPRQVDERKKRERSEQMIELSRRKAYTFRRKFLGREVSVLWENEISPSVWRGLTANYLQVFTKSERDLTNKLLYANLIGDEDKGLRGELNG